MINNLALGTVEDQLEVIRSDVAFRTRFNAVAQTRRIESSERPAKRVDSICAFRRGPAAAASSLRGFPSFRPPIPSPRASSRATSPPGFAALVRPRRSASSRRKRIMKQGADRPARLRFVVKHTGRDRVGPRSAPAVTPPSAAKSRRWSSRRAARRREAVRDGCFSKSRAPKASTGERNVAEGRKATVGRTAATGGIARLQWPPRKAWCLPVSGHSPSDGGPKPAYFAELHQIGKVNNPMRVATTYIQSLCSAS